MSFRHLPYYVFTSKSKMDAEIAKQSAEACEQIISEMGAELHDDLIQKLSIFRLYMDRIERSAQYPEEVENLLIKMRSEFQEVVDSVRKISRQLMPVRMEDDSFQASIEILCQNMARVGTDQIHFESTGDQKKILPIAEMYLYRITQELIHNAFKHSAAWHVWVRLTWTPTLLSIEVEDDGTGFHKIEEFIGRLRKKHNTLKMRTRVIGATISYHQGKKGLLARVELPLTD